MENQITQLGTAQMDPMETVLTTRDSIRSYAIRSGRLTDLHKDAIKSLYPRYGLDWTPEVKVNSLSLFGKAAPLVVEVGFGMGIATALIAERLPDTCFLGLEVHAPGIGKLLSLVSEQGLPNVKVCRHDAIEVIDSMLAPGSVHGFHIFFPDPWPKKKHHKRRIMNPAFARLLASRLETGGYIYFVSDWEEYARETLELLGAQASLRNRYEEWAPRESWRPVTKFEQRAIEEGRIIREMEFLKL